MSETVDIEETQGLEEVKTFEELKLSEDILKGIYAYGWDNPSTIQSKAILPILKGDDVIAQAQSGTGKTGTFSISSLSMVDTKISAPQVLMLSPVKDLAVQTYKIIRTLGQYTGIRTALLIGTGIGRGEMKFKEREDIPEPDFRSHIIVGTPGRVFDSLRRKKLFLKNLKLFILDEADEMLSKGFKEQVQNIFSFLPDECQIALFSATMPVEILQITHEFMRNPVKILVKTEDLT